MEAKLSNWKMIQVKKKHSIKTFVKRKKNKKKNSQPVPVERGRIFCFWNDKKNDPITPRKRGPAPKKKKIKKQRKWTTWYTEFAKKQQKWTKKKKKQQ